MNEKRRYFPHVLAEFCTDILNKSQEKDGVLACCNWRGESYLSSGTGSEDIIMKGLQKLGVISKERADVYPTWKKLAEPHRRRAWKPMIYIVQDKQKLEQLLSSPPAETIDDWRTFCATNQTKIPIDALSFHDALAAVKKAADKSPNKAILLTQAIQNLASHLKASLNKQGAQ